MHLDDEITQRFVDGELTPGRLAAVLDHLEACDMCRRGVEDGHRLSGRASGLIRSIEVPDPGVTVADVRRQAVRRPGAGWRRWAAAALLTIVGATAAYAAYRAPLGSPVDEAGEGAGEGGPAVLPEATDGGVSGITVDAAGTIHIQDLGPDGGLSVALHDGTGITIRSTGPETTFDAEVDRVSVRWGASATAQVSVEIPRSAPGVTIVLGDRVVWAWEGGRVTTVMEEGEDGTYRLTGAS